MKRNLKEGVLGHIVQQFKPVNQNGEESPLSYGEDNLDEADFNECATLDQAKEKLRQTFASRQSTVAEDDMMQDMDPSMQGGAQAGAQAQTGGTLGSAGQGAGGGQYPPGTAPTMPESVNHKGKVTMEKVDSDISTWINRFKAYDELRASKNPMMEKKAEVKEAGPDKKDVPAFLRKEKGGEWKTTKDDLEKEKDSRRSDAKTLAKDSKKLEETADAETMNWVARFAKLGNMKGYGR